MIVTASKHVNARLGKPNTNEANPRFLVPGEKVNVKARVFGETLEGNNEWFLTDENEFFTQLGFHLPKAIADIPFDNVPELFKQLEISKLWSISKGEGINVGIIDMTGVANSSALKGRVIPINYDINNADITNHSTHMASIIAANDFEKSEVGIAPAINKIFSYRIENELLPSNQLLDSLTAFKNTGVKIINMSISSTSFDLKKYSALKSILEELVKSNVILISSTGNRPINKPSIPAALKGVISVSGYVQKLPIEWDGNSNVWNGVNISAPYNQYFDENFKNMRGTSNACAIISGVLACSYQRILKNKDGSNLYEYITKKIFSDFTKILYPVNNVNVPLYSTDKFVNLLK